MLPAEAADQVAAFFICHSCDGTGIDDDESGISVILPPSLPAEKGGQRPSFFLIDLAAEIMDGKGTVLIIFGRDMFFHKLFFQAGSIGQPAFFLSFFDDLQGRRSKG